MKRFFITCALLVTAISVSAQNPYMALTGVFEKDGQLSIEIPRSEIAVDLTVEKELILCGPYARYAQKFLGVRAPLTDKTTYTLKGASLALVDSPVTYVEATLPTSEPTVHVSSHSRSIAEFARIQPDKVDMTTPVLEDAARDAATAIFALRKNRMELISGDAGENVFGAGLESALNEIARLEQDYLELFMGKRVVTSYSSQRFVLTPRQAKRQYIICRFSPDAGIVPDSDLSGEVVVLQITPSGDTAFPFEASRKETIVMPYRIADPSDCSVVCGTRMLGKSVLPLFEFGRTVYVAVPRKK